MDKIEIQTKLEKVFDDFTTEVLTKSIFDFQRLFNEKYLKTEEVINLVITNIPNGIKLYDNNGSVFDATCSIKSQEFKINKEVLNDREYFDYVFFHEFIHSISYKKCNGLQYMGFYTLEKGEDYSFKSTSFNEVVTEYIALKRNEMYNYKKESGVLSGYDLGAVELKLLTKIIPEEEIINSYFNEPDQLDNILKKYNMNLDEIFYSFHQFENMALDVHALERKYGIQYIDRLFKLIDAERYFFYNLLDSFGDIKTEEEFNKKWSILLSEYDLKYNFYNIDGIFKYGMLYKDIEKLNISSNNQIYIQEKEKIEKYNFLFKIFEKEDNDLILEKLSNIYKEDYRKYSDLVKDDFAILSYTFLNKLKNNYELADIEIYPRVYPYLKQEKTTIDKVEFKKIRCEEIKMNVYIFNINGNNYVECNYDDAIIKKKTNTLFEVTIYDHTGILDLEKKIYTTPNKEVKFFDLY